MAQGGWYPDPLGRFEQRYFDGTQWTEHVARAGAQLTDPRGIAPTASEQVGAEVPVAATQAASGTAERSSAPASTAPPSTATTKATGRPRWLVPGAVIAAVAVVAIVGFVVLGGGNGGDGGDGLNDPFSRGTPTGDGIVLSPDGLGVATFDDPGEDVVAAVTAVLGEPRDDFDGLPTFDAPYSVDWDLGENLYLSLLFRGGDFTAYTVAGALTTEEYQDPDRATVLWTVDGVAVGARLATIESKFSPLVRCRDNFGSDFAANGATPGILYTINQNSSLDFELDVDPTERVTSVSGGARNASGDLGDLRCEEFVDETWN